MTPKIPLILELKKNKHKQIARVQDLVMGEVYSLFNEAILHGGTAIWRCYGGNRFSEDIDVYISKNKDRINKLFENLENKGFVIEKKKIGKNSLYSTLKLDRTIIRLEALFKSTKAELREYERIDGNLIMVYTLSPEELVKEKIEAYLKRRKIRDLYDVFFLLKYSEKDKIRKNLKKLETNYEKPIDEKELKVLILKGLVPSSEEMLEYIKR